MIEREKVGRSAAPVKAGKVVEPTDAEVVAAARALWRFDICGLLLENGEHVLCDDARVPPRQRRARCACRERSRTMLAAAAAKRPKPPIEKLIVDKPIADKPVAEKSVSETPAAEKPAADIPSAPPVPTAPPAPDLEAPSLQQAPSVVPPHGGDGVREPSAWQPVATLPPSPPEGEGKRVLYLLFDPAIGVTPGYWVADPWGGGDWFGISASIDKLHPTHWMPLPDRP